MPQYYIDVSTTSQSHDPTPDTYVTRLLRVKGTHPSRVLSSYNKYNTQVSSVQDSIIAIQTRGNFSPVLNKMGTSSGEFYALVISEQDRILAIQQRIPVDVPFINKDDIPKGLYHTTPEGGMSSTVNLIGKYS